MAERLTTIVRRVKREINRCGWDAEAPLWSAQKYINFRLELKRGY